VKIRHRTEQDFDEKHNKVMINSDSPSIPPAQQYRTLSGRSNPSAIRTDYESYRRYHSQPPTPPPALSPHSSPLFGHGSIAHDEAGPWFYQKR
jgi:hypothetical protein